MKNKILFLVIGLIIITAKTVLAEDSDIYNLGKIVVTATKTEELESEVGSSTTIITADEIKKTGQSTLLETLRYVPGVVINQGGYQGGVASIYLRGSKPGHTLIMLDGVELNDPMSIDRSFDLAHLTTDNIERIEIIRGPQATLYGSDAMGGVINLITKKGKGKPKFTISSQLGSYNTFKEITELSGGTKKSNYSFSILRLDSEGISQAHGGSEKDGYINNTFSSRLGYKIIDHGELNLMLHYTNITADLDDGSYLDDPNYTFWNKNFTGKIEFAHNPLSWWNHKISYSHNYAGRKYRDEVDSVHTTEDDQSWYKGNGQKFEWQHNFLTGKDNTLTGGLEYEKETGASLYRSGATLTTFNRKSINNKALYLQNQLKLWEKIVITPGLRIDHHELFGSEATYKISSSCLLPGKTRLKANWGTGFKAPSLYQLYSTEDYGGGPIGDPNLKPDKSKSYDIGFEQPLFKNKVSLGVTYFDNNFKNMVDWDYNASKYKNIGRAQTKGLELEANFKPIKTISLNANYTYLDAKDKDTGKKLIGRPQDQGEVNFNWSVSSKTNLNFAAKYVGHRWDDSNNTRETKRYAKVDFYATYDLTKNFQAFTKIENIFDKEYMEVLGYSTLGRSFYAGGKVSF